MPTYQYRCTSCGEDLEVHQKFTDAALTTCPACSGQLRKVFNAVGVVFKGSGFYATDSRKKSSSTLSANGSATKAESIPAATETTSSAKPETTKAAAS